MSVIGHRFAEALLFAAEAHGTQERKGSGIPYISHPISVSGLVLSFGGDEDQAIIALLHDVLEDCGVHHADPIRRRFGLRVLEGARGCSDCFPVEVSAKGDWRARKEAYIRHLATASDDVLLVSICDKLHNASAIVQDIERDGVVTLGRFRGGRDGTLWYYNALYQAFRARGRAVPAAAVLQLGDRVARMHALAAPGRGSAFG